MIKRLIETNITAKLNKGKAIIILGQRQVGKTTILKTVFTNSSELLWLNGDELDVQELFSNMSAARFSAIIGEKKIIIIDEAQRIQDIGRHYRIAKE